MVLAESLGRNSDYEWEFHAITTITIQNTRGGGNGQLKSNLQK